MRAIRKFDEFVKANIVKKQNPDKSRSEFLVNSAGNSYENLLEMVQKIELNDKNANDFVKICYDIIMELIRARMLLDGYNSSGTGAHEAEVSYMKVLDFEEKDIQFSNQMRFFRNGIVYYGTTLDKVYAEKVIAFTKYLYPKLKKLVKEA